MTRRDSSKRKHAECLCVAAKERRNQATLACLRHSTQIEGIGSQLEVLTKEITQFVTSINETLLCQKTRDVDKGEVKLKDEKTYVIKRQTKMALSVPAFLTAKTIFPYVKFT